MLSSLPRLSASFAARTTTVSNRYRSPGFGPWPSSHSSAGAFASGSPGRVNEFHLSPANTPAVGVLSALWGSGTLLPGHLSAELLLPPPPCRLRTFNRSKHLLRSLPRYYRAGWHRSLAQIPLAVCCRASSSPQNMKNQGGRPLTVSASGHWTVFAPAASLDYESLLSGFLCGTGP